MIKKPGITFPGNLTQQQASQAGIMYVRKAKLKEVVQFQSDFVRLAYLSNLFFRTLLNIYFVFVIGLQTLFSCAFCDTFTHQVHVLSNNSYHYACRLQVRSLRLLLRCIVKPGSRLFYLDASETNTTRPTFLPLNYNKAKMACALSSKKTTL